MKRRVFNIRAVAAAVLGVVPAVANASRGKFRTYSGPEIHYVVVNKAARRMYLLHNKEVVRRYDIDLGFEPDGHKQFAGDGRTPEGLYRIDRRNPNSKFYLSLGISYPNSKDRAQARKLGKSPGGDIFIHGQPNKRRMRERDWTAGCISVKNREMAEIYAMVKNGTIIAIRP
jgi:murein L,D-transpeptidase YafK